MLLTRAARFVRRKFRGALCRARDRRKTTYAREWPRGPLHHYLPSPAEDGLSAHERAVLDVRVGYWLDHRFDLLGSGWTQVRHGMDCRGLEGHRYPSGPAIQHDPEGQWLHARVNAANLAESQRIWRLVDPGYLPIDWQLDFKSGYRWSEGTWHGDIRFGHLPGVDVKVPWELAQGQHLPQLALAYGAAASRGADARPAALLGEFRNEILDFVATNPPYFGVNWCCSLELAIRAVNWLVALDMFRAAGASFDRGFTDVLTRSLYEHGLYIMAHLERHGRARGNHYLGNVTGMLFLAAYLPSTPVIDGWLRFAVGELVSEVGVQFHPDGSHFEASTSYHRFCAEMAAYATALVLGLPAEKRSVLERDGAWGLTPFPAWYAERLQRMMEFIAHATKSNGRLHQVGDNDSGRLLRLCPAGEVTTVAQARACCRNLRDYAEMPADAPYWRESVLDSRSLPSAIGCLLDQADRGERRVANPVEARVIAQLSGGRVLPPCAGQSRGPQAARVRVGSAGEGPALLARLENDAQMRRCTWELSRPKDDLLDGVACYGYPDFGLFVFRSRRLYLGIRCGRIARPTWGSHVHNDQLAVELCLDGEDLIADPGSYLYTPDVAWRNAYRSAAAHFVPHLADGREPCPLDNRVFFHRGHGAGECLLFVPYRFVGRHLGYGRPVYRVVELEARAVRITDYADRSLTLRPPAPLDAQGLLVPSVPFSPGYGVQLATVP